MGCENVKLFFREPLTPWASGCAPWPRPGPNADCPRARGAIGHGCGRPCSARRISSEEPGKSGEDLPCSPRHTRFHERVELDSFLSPRRKEHKEPESGKVILFSWRSLRLSSRLGCWQCRHCLHAISPSLFSISPFAHFVVSSLKAAAGSSARPGLFGWRDRPGRSGLLPSRSTPRPRLDPPGRGRARRA